MALSKENREYLDQLGAGLRGSDILINILKDVLTNEIVVNIKNGIKAKKLEHLRAEKDYIEDRIVELSK